MLCTDSSWLEIDSQALEHNIHAYKSIIGTALLAPVIKSNAYGHGIELIAKLCDQNPLVDYLCVVSLSEALLLRSIGIKKPLLVISIIDRDLEQAVIQDIDVIVYDHTILDELNRLGKKLNKKARVHIKVDTGLSRLGLSPDQAICLIKQIEGLPHIEIKGIFTHLAESESADQTFTNYQVGHFNTVTVDQKILRHVACTAAITASAQSHCSFVRLGIGLYGLWPSPENKKLTQENHPGFLLRPVLTWKTRIIQIKDIPAGSYIGYDRTHQVSSPTRIAILPIGYYDGYDRRLSSNGVVTVNNQHAPILGRIAMNLSVIDITGLDVGQEHEVTLLGKTPGITADDLAQNCNTINYEIVTRINPLLPRRLAFPARF